MGDVKLAEGYYCANAKLYENGIFIDEESYCRQVVDRNASIVANSIRYNEYQMNHRTYSKVSYLTPGDTYRVTMTLSNSETGNNIMIEDHEWVATYGARTFGMHGIDLPIGEYCLTTVLYENGSEIDSHVSCRKVICQYDTSSLDAGSDEGNDSDKSSSIIGNVIEAIIDVISEVITEIFAEVKNEDEKEPESDSDDLIDDEETSVE